MRDRPLYDYAIVRVVPRPEREEFLNVGAIVSCADARFLEARIVLDEPRLRAFTTELDLETVRGHLASFPLICAGGIPAGPIGRLGQRERFHWLVAQRSAVIQTSPVHTGRCESPGKALDHLMRGMVLAPEA